MSFSVIDVVGLSAVFAFQTNLVVVFLVRGMHLNHRLVLLSWVFLHALRIETGVFTFKTCGHAVLAAVCKA